MYVLYFVSEKKQFKHSINIYSWLNESDEFRREKNACQFSIPIMYSFKVCIPSFKFRIKIWNFSTFNISRTRSFIHSGWILSTDLHASMVFVALNSLSLVKYFIYSLQSFRSFIHTLPKGVCVCECACLLLLPSLYC